MATYRLTPDAIEDIDGIWSFISLDNPEAAYSVEEEIAAACAWLAEGPLRGHFRRDLTKLPVRFWPLPRYPSYIIFYLPQPRPLCTIRVLHAIPDVTRILRG